MSDRILMIEDDAHLAAMVSEYLAANGFEVAVAPRAERGLAMLDSGSKGHGPGSTRTSWSPARRRVRAGHASRGA